MSDAPRISPGLTERSLVAMSNAWWSCSDVADHLGHKNIQNTRICAQITTSLRHEVLAKLGRHPEIVRVA